MKKILALIMAIMMVLSLCACGTDTEVIPVDDAPAVVVDAASDEPTGEPTEEIMWDENTQMILENMDAETLAEAETILVTAMTEALNAETQDIADAIMAEANVAVEDLLAE